MKPSRIETPRWVIYGLYAWAGVGFVVMVKLVVDATRLESLNHLRDRVFEAEAERAAAIIEHGDGD